MRHYNGSIGIRRRTKEIEMRQWYVIAWTEGKCFGHQRIKAENAERAAHLFRISWQHRTIESVMEER
jgi:phosphomevalonate kinase